MGNTAMADTAPATERGVTAPPRGPKGVNFYIWMKDGEGKSYGGSPVARGQVLELRGLPNDAKLMQAGYVEKLEKQQLTQCLHCGVWFIADQYKQLHSEFVHPGASDEEVDLGDEVVV